MARQVPVAGPAGPAGEVPDGAAGGSAAAPDGTTPAGGEGTATGTRERILEVALDLFIEQGFEKTSLREIAERLGFSKAALYYHFAGKEDILAALHMRLHAIGEAAIARLGPEPAGTGAWRDVLDRVVDDMLAHRKLFVLHQRNPAAFEQLHLNRAGHSESHEDMEAVFRRALSDDSVPVRDRVRLASALGALVTGLVLAGGAFDDVPTETLGPLLREVVHDLLGPGPAVR